MSKYRPSTAYSTLSPRSGRAVDLPWLMPPRAQTAVPYTKLEPTFGPRVHAVVSTKGLLEGGSALDRRNLKVMQSDLVPRPETMALPPLRAKTAADALYRSMERYGPMRGVDEGWASLHGGQHWSMEYKRSSEKELSLNASIPLRFRV